MWALFAFSCFNVESFVSSPSRSLCFDWRCLRYRRRRRVDVEASQFESDSASSRSDRRSRKDRDPKTETRIPRSKLRPKFLEFLLELSSWNKNRDFIKQLAKSQEFFFFLALDVTVWVDNFNNIDSFILWIRTQDHILRVFRQNPLTP